MLRTMSEQANPPALNAASVSRRRFVKTFALGTASSVLFGKVWRASVLADITPSGPGRLKIKVSDYPALGVDFGSVRLGFNPIFVVGNILTYYIARVFHKIFDVMRISS